MQDEEQNKNPGEKKECGTNGLLKAAGAVKAILSNIVLEKERSNKGNLAACIIEAGIFLKHSLNRLRQEANLLHNNCQLEKNPLPLA